VGEPDVPLLEVAVDDEVRARPHLGPYGVGRGLGGRLGGLVPRAEAVVGAVEPLEAEAFPAGGLQFCVVPRAGRRVGRGGQIVLHHEDLRGKGLVERAVRAVHGDRDVVRAGGRVGVRWPRVAVTGRHRGRAVPEVPFDGGVDRRSGKGKAQRAAALGRAGYFDLFRLREKRGNEGRQAYIGYPPAQRYRARLVVAPRADHIGIVDHAERGQAVLGGVDFPVRAQLQGSYIETGRMEGYLGSRNVCGREVQLKYCPVVTVQEIAVGRKGNAIKGPIEQSGAGYGSGKIVEGQQFRLWGEVASKDQFVPLWGKGHQHTMVFHDIVQGNPPLGDNRSRVHTVAVQQKGMVVTVGRVTPHDPVPQAVRMSCHRDGFR